MSPNENEMPIPRLSIFVRQEYHTHINSGNKKTLQISESYQSNAFDLNAYEPSVHPAMVLSHT